MTNLLKALINIVENPIEDLIEFYSGANRVNNMGVAFETYIKDVFCNSLKSNGNERKYLYSQHFSYLGNQNNPPDIIIKNGDAIEVKKIESPASAIALNSSYPKNKLYVDDSRITKDCRECETNQWSCKDIIYVIGTVPKKTNKIKSIWFVYGDCYAASRDVYQKILDKISCQISQIQDIEFIDTNEIAKIKKVDPLGITDLRVRGMWHIDNPKKVFNDLITSNTESDFMVNALLLTDKYNCFPLEDRLKLEGLQNKGLCIKSVEISSPDNPAKLLNAKVITYELSYE